MKCCICKKDAGEFGNNAQPVMEGSCCDKCNEGVVIPIRMAKFFKKKSSDNANCTKVGGKRND